MPTFQSWMSVVLSLALGACAAVDAAETTETEVETTSSALQTDTNKPTSFYYSVKHDQRRCASPMCGGYWVSALNAPRMRCADGTTAKQCYVAEIELASEITLDDGDLVRGSHVTRNYPQLNARYGVIKADFALTPVLDTSASTGAYYLGYDTGIRCIRSPCPSFGLATLNTQQSFTDRGFAFAGANAEEDALLQEAFLKELGEGSSTGAGVVAFGNIRKRYDASTRAYKRELAVSNVYLTKEPPADVCLVLTEGARTTAWNFASRAEAEELAAGLSGEIEVIEGRCGDARIICPQIYLPVHGTIDALGEDCVEESNACSFRGAVIQAAGQDGKAQGEYTDGPCLALAWCEVDADCEQGFCGWTGDDSRVCRAWSQLGETCGGFRLPEYRRTCAPHLFCQNIEPTGDAGGVCVEL